MNMNPVLFILIMIFHDTMYVAVPSWRGGGVGIVCVRVMVVGTLVLVGGLIFVSQGLDM